jgi:uncharacterized protein (TIGR00299 family) protein
VNTLYLECKMGAAGDMLMAALYELLEDDAQESFLQQINALGLPKTRVSASQTARCGIIGTRIAVQISGREEHEHQGAFAHPHHARHTPATGFAEIESLLASLPVSILVREHAAQVYRLIAEAESAVHGCPVEQIHFHEVGQLDAVIDIVGVSMLLELLAPERIVASAIHVGDGQARAAHGVLPVPAPATARLLHGIPCYGSSIKEELCTPTGAALLRHFVETFRAMPPMRVAKVGYGMGAKDFPAVLSCVRAFFGESADADATRTNDTVAELCCNLDDMTGEAIAHAAQRLLAAGALDVFTVPAQMKKGRPGVLLTCLCAPAEAERFAALMLAHTTSFGVRKTLCDRYLLARAVAEKQTRLGSVRIKRGEGYGVAKSKPEYEDIAALAEKNGISFMKAVDDILQEN